MKKHGFRLDRKTHRILWVIAFEEDRASWKQDFIPQWYREEKNFNLGKEVYAIEE